MGKKNKKENEKYKVQASMMFASIVFISCAMLALYEVIIEGISRDTLFFLFMVVLFGVPGCMAHKTLTELSADKKYLGAKLGYICVLHTWGSRMNYHPHLHTIVLGGGLDENNKWKDKEGKLFFPYQVLSAVFKRYYLEEVKDLRRKNKLEYHGSSEVYKNHYEFKELLNKLYSKEWIVHIKPAFNGAQSVINYLGRYMLC